MATILKGMGGGSSMAVTGRVSKDHLNNPGDVLVTKTTDPSLFVDMREAIAVVTDTGGVVCHAAIVCTEMGIPFVVGTKTATKELNDGDFVTVDPVAGTVEVVA